MQKRLQKELTELFGQQAAEFLNPNHQIVPFDSSYKPDEQEILEIAQYALPQEIADAAAHPHQVDPFTFEDNFKIKAIIATEHDATRGSTAAYFQVMNKTKILNRGNGLAILLSGNTFKKLDEPGLTLDTKLSAVYQNANLYLKSFAVVNRFLDLNDYFREATDEEIEAVLGDKAFAVEDAEAVVAQSDSWMRKRFSALLASGVLAKVKAKTAANRARKYGITIEVRMLNGKQAIAFPTDKRGAKQLLSFLNEEYYQGELSERLYQTNSKRVLATSAPSTN